MNTRTLHMTLLGLALAALVPASQAQSRYESRGLLRVTCNPRENPLTPETLQALIQSPAVLFPAATACGSALGNFEEPLVSINLYEVQTSIEGGEDGGVMTLSAVIAVELTDPEPAGQERANCLLSQIGRRLNDVLVADSQLLAQRAADRVAAAGDTLGAARQVLERIHNRQVELTTAAGRTSLVREELLDGTRATENQLETLEFQLVGLNARQRALAEQIARIGTQAEQRATADPVAVELERVVKLREGNLERATLLVKSGHAPESELNGAEESLALARADLARQRQSAVQAAGGEQLADLNRELIMLAVNIAEAEAQRAHLQQRLAAAREKGLLALADQYECDVELPLPLARDALQEAQRALDEVQRQVRANRPPSVSILGSAPAGAAAPGSK